MATSPKKKQARRLAGQPSTQKPPSRFTGSSNSFLRPDRRKGDGRTITVPLTLDLELYAEILAMGEYDRDASFSASVTDSMDGDVEAWLEAPNKPAPARFLKRWLKAHPPASLVPSVPLVDVSRAITAAQYQLARQAALAAEYEEGDPWIIARNAFESWTIELLSQACGMGDAAAEAAWEAAGKKGQCAGSPACPSSWTSLPAPCYAGSSRREASTATRAKKPVTSSTRRSPTTWPTTASTTKVSTSTMGAKCWSGPKVPDWPGKERRWREKNPTTPLPAQGARARRTEAPPGR